MKGFEALESIHIGLVNFDFGGRSSDEARRLVKAGEARWVHGQGSTLKLVPNGYALLDYERFLREEEPGHFVHERA